MNITHQKKYLFLIVKLFIFKLFLFAGQSNGSLSGSVHKDFSTPYDHRQKEWHKQFPGDKIIHKDVSSRQQNKKHGILTSEDNNSSVWSNAFNFKNAWGANVDQRTGMLAAHFKTGSLLSNVGHGPNIDLQINFNSNSFANPDGIGQGWSWNLTHFNKTTDQLTTSGGQNFYLHQLGKNNWQPLYHKLNDIKIEGDKSTWFIITYANGLRETLNHDGYETRLEQQNGWGVNFIYQHGTHLLQYVADDEGNKITITRSSGYLDIISHKSDGKPVTIRIKSYHGRPETITFLSAHSPDNPIIHLNYNQYFFRVIYPSGLKQIFTFNCSDAMKLSLPGMPLYKLCVVAKEEENPGAGQPIIKNRYRYSDASVNGHNYMGFGAETASVVNAKRDILFEAPVDYVYRTVKDNDQVKELHTYNKYHLLIDSKLISDHTGKVLSETQNFFCNTNREDACSQSSFEDLPSTYSLPLKVVTRVWGTSSGTPAVTTINREYDNSGRLTRSIDVYGRVIRIWYCPVAGDLACPAAPAGWPFSNLPELIAYYPAPSDTQVAPPVITVNNTYRKANNLHGQGYVLVSASQTRQSGNQYITLTRHYYKDPDNILTYGLLKQTVLTGSPASSSMKSVVYNYHYVMGQDGHSQTTYSSVDLGENKRKFLPSVTTSLFTNQVIKRTDSTGKNITRYHYDIFDRLTRVDLATGTPFSSSLHYHYLFMPEHNQVTVTAVNGMQQKIIFDNAGRELMHFDEAISPSGKAIPDQWQLKKSVYYDAYGRDTETDTYTTDNSGKRYILKTTKDYDDMGRVSHVYLPDGETVFMLYDNPDRCMVSYRQSSEGEHSAIYAVLGNVLDQPIEKRFFPASLMPIPSVKTLCDNKNRVEISKTTSTTYDGFGRIIITKDIAGRVTSGHYDALGRLDDITDPAGNHIYQRYNLIGKVTEHWALPVSGGRYLLSSSGYNSAGQLLYKSGEDGKKTTFTYTEAGRPATVTTPAGHLFSWKYNLLGLPIVKYVDGKIFLQSDYDPVTTKPISKRDITGITKWTYSIDGLPEKLVHHGENGYSDYQLLWSYNNDRRVISKTDAMGNITQTEYDKFGRISALQYQPQNGLIQTVYMPVYDQFSRISAMHYGSGMDRIVRYDSWGRQQEVTDTLANKLLFRWKFNYDISDNIVSLVQQENNHQQATLKYQYDILDNLVSMRCEGNNNLSLCPRDTAFADTNLKSAPVIVNQHYSFTPLNRISQVKETLQNSDTRQTLSKETVYSYGNLTAPLRLQKISTSWNQETPAIHNFSYDVVGNMTTDGEGNQMTYNAFNQITSVIKANGQQSNYAYDGGGLEVMERSPSGTRYLFYSGRHMINEKINSPQEGIHKIGYHGAFRTIDGAIHEYDERNYKGDVVGLLTKTAENSNLYRLSQRNIYSPYGMVWHHQQIPYLLHLQNFSGFDGERTDPATGWQFLGEGHRTYNPEQRYFVSEDPFGAGYAFGNNNPVMNTDPTGNMSKGAKSFFTILGYAGTLGLGAINSTWAIVGSVSMLILSSLFTGIFIACQTGSLIAPLPVVNFMLALGLVSIGCTIAAPHSKVAQAVGAIAGGIQLLVSAFFVGLMIKSGIVSCCFASKLSTSTNSISEATTAGRAINAASETFGDEPPRYEMLSMHELNHNSYGSVETNSPPQLQERTALLIDEPDESYSYFGTKIDDQITEMKRAEELVETDLSAVKASAELAGKSLDMQKVLTFLRAKAGIDEVSPEDAFRNLMSDVSSYMEVVGDRKIDWETDLFPQGTKAVFIKGKTDAGLVKRLEGNTFGFMPLGATDSKLVNIVKTPVEIYARFADMHGDLLITEYYRIS